MMDKDAVESNRILHYAIEALGEVRHSRLSTEKWKLFGGYVARMDAALDRGDLAEVNLCRQQIEALETLQGAKAGLGGGPEVPLPVGLRQQADRLTERLGKGKGKDPGARAGRPR
ncbi:CATRA system-associated protein [Micromonospora sp. NPDC047527]|uniref:CATRA system-associated protein n=1 Tax=Micromonospora sp. NPDC047527 TaxID=3155144 RepID=UPI00340FBFA0